MNFAGCGSKSVSEPKRETLWQRQPPNNVYPDFVEIVIHISRARWVAEPFVIEIVF